MAKKSRSNTPRTLNIGTYAGIPVKIHWTFGFLLLFILYTSFTEHLDLKTSLLFLLYILILFLCVTLHEYGHALTGRRFNVPTGEILLTPIGGIAKMGAMSKKPKDEFFIAMAGPMVNVVIACILAIIIYYFFDGQYIPSTDDYGIFTRKDDFIRMVLLMNIMLVVFNLIPAYPMDGGRVLRSLIAMKTGFDKATIYATTIGMIIATCFLGIAFYLSHPTLGFIGLFIFFMANNERKQSKKSLMLNSSIEPYINKNFTLISSSSLLENYYPLIHDNQNTEKDFLVKNDKDEIIGSLPEKYIIEAERSHPELTYVYEFMRNSFGKQDVNNSIIETAHYLNDNDYYVIAVYKNEVFVGTIDRTIITKLYGK